MKLPMPIKYALIEAMITQYTEDHPSSRVSEETLTFSIPVVNILEDTNDFGITDSDIQDVVTENTDSLSYSKDSGTLHFTSPFTRSSDLYNESLNYIKESTASNAKFTIGYDSAIKESLIYHFFKGSIVLMVPEDMSNPSQLKFALTVGGSKLRVIIDDTGGWIYVFPKYTMESMECGKMPARESNVQQVLASYLEDVFPEET
ncbi:hypothetical protein V7O66_04105 [Methanolobus sp. ZRKC3]|uniref:hypothetical protein n=1 Tax=Methanolobus sp. ZRKC3 TaxID=3125786 RepID=UPI0032459F3A